MATSLNIKRKNIDLPVETLNKLSILAAASGKSLKKFIETILISKANSVNIDISENPSPSGDSWFNVPENVAMIKEGMAEMQEGKTVTHSAEDIKQILGL